MEPVGIRCSGLGNNLNSYLRCPGFSAAFLLERRTTFVLPTFGSVIPAYAHCLRRQNQRRTAVVFYWGLALGASVWSFGVFAALVFILGRLRRLAVRVADIAANVRLLACLHRSSRDVLHIRSHCQPER